MPKKWNSDLDGFQKMFPGAQEEIKQNFHFCLFFIFEKRTLSMLLNRKPGLRWVSPHPVHVRDTGKSLGSQDWQERAIWVWVPSPPRGPDQLDRAG